MVRDFQNVRARSLALARVQHGRLHLLPRPAEQKRMPPVADTQYE